MLITDNPLGMRWIGSSLMVALLASPLLGETWTRFRGPNGAGVSEGAALPASISPGAAIWTQELPAGKSSPVFAKDRIYLTAHQDERLLTLALDRETGRILWTRQAPSRRLEKMNKLNDEAASTPVTDGENVYAFFAGYGLIAYSGQGEERWRRPMGPFTNFHGMGASPVYSQGKVLMICDQDQGAYLIALNSDDGSVAWRVDRPEMVHSFSTPTLYKPDEGPEQVIVPGSYQLVAYQVATGEEVWRYNGLTYQVKSTGLVAGGRFYFSGWAPGGEPAVRLVLPPFEEALEKLDQDGDRHLSKQEIPKEWQPGSWGMQDLDKDGRFDARDWQYYSQRRTSTNSAMAIKLGGRGDVTATHLAWQYQKSLPDVPSVLLYRNLLYLVRNGGILTTLNPDTGEVVKQGRLRDAISGYYASPVAGDGKIYFASEDGKVSILEAGEDWQVLQTAEFGEDIFATPAIADARLYIRTSSRLYCFGRS